MPPLPNTRAAQASSQAKKTTSFDVEHLRKDFPALHRRVNGHPLIYLDTAASCHKLKVLVDRLSELYLGEYAKPSETTP